MFIKHYINIIIICLITIYQIVNGLYYLSYLFLPIGLIFIGMYILYNDTYNVINNYYQNIHRIIHTGMFSFIRKELISLLKMRTMISIKT